LSFNDLHNGKEGEVEVDYHEEPEVDIVPELTQLLVNEFAPAIVIVKQGI